MQADPRQAAVKRVKGRPQVRGQLKALLRALTKWPTPPKSVAVTIGTKRPRMKSNEGLAQWPRVYGLSGYLPL